MSRPLKFRAWDNGSKIYLRRIANISFDMAGQLHHVDGEQTNRSDITVLYDKLLLEQSTGLKDKNGKEIYEGDIIKINGNINYYVDFEHGGFWFNNDNRKWKANRPLTHFVEINDCEVIGNIHENPELLGGEDA